MVDTHCHIFSCYYDDIGGVIDRAKANDINILKS